MNNSTKIDDKMLLKHQVVAIIEGLEQGITYDQCGMDHEERGAHKDDVISGWDYVEDSLNIEYMISSEGQYLGARILVAFGGPDIWINTRNQTVEGAWWGDHHTQSYLADAMDINDACEELYSCNIHNFLNI